MDVTEIERRVAAAQERVETLQHRALAGTQDPMVAEALQELQTSMEELSVTVEALHEQNEALAAADRSAFAEQERYRDLFELAPVGYLVTGPSGAIRAANRAAARLLNLQLRYLRGKPLISFVAVQDRAFFRDLLIRISRSEHTVEWTTRLVPRRSLPIDASIIVSAANDLPGRAVALRWVIYDVTAQRRADEQLAVMNAELERQVADRTAQIEESSRLKDNLLLRETAAREAAEAARHRLGVLAEASTLLAVTLDGNAIDAMLNRAATLALPLLGDWCLVDLLGLDGAVRRVAVVHADAQEHALAEQLRKVPGHGEALSAGSSRVAPPRPAHAVVVSRPDAEALRQLFPNEDERQLVSALPIRGVVRVPLVARGEALGSMTFLSADDGRRVESADIALAEEIANRAATAVDQARLYHEAQEASAAKSAFLATMSHELRTPLNAIIGYTELLLLGVPQPVSREAGRQVERIRAASEHLLSIIEEILTFSRVDAGNARLFTELLTPGTIAREAAALVEPMARAKELELSVDISAALPQMETDAGRLRQILANLLSNAVKFTGHGSVMLGVRPERNGVAFSVRDTGAGIPHESLERVFEPFWQERYPNMPRAGGTGLGLSISRQLARLLGGDLSVQSTLGRGSTFTVWLPERMARTPADAAPPSARSDGGAAEGAGQESLPGPIDAPAAGENARNLPYARARANGPHDERHELGG